MYISKSLNSITIDIVASSVKLKYHLNYTELFILKLILEVLTTGFYFFLIQAKGFEEER